MSLLARSYNSPAPGPRDTGRGASLPYSLKLILLEFRDMAFVSDPLAARLGSNTPSSFGFCTFVRPKAVSGGSFQPDDELVIMGSSG